MEKKNYLRVIRSTYYGDDVSLNLNCIGYSTNSKPYKNYSKNGIEVIFDSDDFDGSDIYIFFEDNAKSFGQALLILIDIVKEECVNAYLNPHHLGDLAKLILDHYVGEDAYKNIKENYSFMNKQCYSYWGVERNITTYTPCYDDGNNLYYFGEKNGCCALTRKPELFKQQAVRYLISNTKLTDLAKAICDNEGFNYSKEVTETNYHSIVTRITELEAEKKEIEKKLIQCKKELEELKK